MITTALGKWQLCSHSGICTICQRFFRDAPMWVYWVGLVSHHRICTGCADGVVENVS